MKKLLSTILIAMFLLSTSFTSLADDETKNIKLELEKDGSAEVQYGNETFEIKYIRYNNQILIGKGADQDLLKLLNIASDLSGQKYDLTLRHRAWTNSFEDTSLPNYDTIITEYQKSNEFHEGITALYDSHDYAVTKTLEFYPGGVIENGWPYGFDDSTDAMPHVSLIDGEYYYYLPLRYLFEQLGFSVSYSNENISISYNQSK